MSDLNPQTQIARAANLLATEVDGETVLMHVEQGQYYGLARSAHVIWELLAEPQSFEQLCAALQRRYAGAPETIAADTRRFVEQMAAEALVTLD
ncbi:PqqD family protein [Rubrivivax sp. A210]|uniref:PqqD family protein n=1 Tax=Rubrivivax sp. A210 TaxID=2772301 RepID=UPI001918E4CD|nr:PqqD family protein [Rubrivivax sp. A210]CAD5372618.1 PqqD family protein [Rubrivivax sp. A210]